MDNILFFFKSIIKSPYYLYYFTNFSINCLFNLYKTLKILTEKHNIIYIYRQLHIINVSG